MYELPAFWLELLALELPLFCFSVLATADDALEEEADDVVEDEDEVEALLELLSSS